VEPYRFYLLYHDDGATLTYAGPSADEYARLSRGLAATHAGSLTGTRPVGRAQEWEVRSFFRACPSPEFIAQRRHFFRFRLDWDPGDSTAADAAS
jgi:hypothetical protein